MLSKLIILSLQRVNDGFTVMEIQNFMYFITFFRFLFYSSYYNMQTGFSISCISFIAAKCWYSHLLYTTKTYQSMILTSNTALKIWASHSYQITQKQMNNNFTVLPSFSLILNTFIRQCFGDADNSYRIDPISLLFSRLPMGLRKYTDSFYYTIWNNIVPSALKIIYDNVIVSKSAFTYLLIIRYGKKLCPYLIRWHWTYIFLCSILSQILSQFPLRLQEFAVVNYLYEELYDNYFAMQAIIGLFITIHITCILFALFHALFGQYFYTPFLSDNVELHVGKRPKNSIYSGGYTAWQDAKKISDNSDSKKRRLWWGWFGRGLRDETPIIPKTRQNRRRKIFTKLRQLLKDLFDRFF